MPDEATLETIRTVVIYIFSWFILLSVAVIVSGKLLAKTITLTVRGSQEFFINLWLLRIKSTDDEVILGFTGFIITLLILAGLRGAAIYELVKNEFGVDPGHFYAVCMFCSFVTVAWSFLMFVLTTFRGPKDDSTSTERDRLIDSFAAESPKEELEGQNGHD